MRHGTTKSSSSDDGAPRHESEAGWSVMSTVIAGILVWGGAGFGLDRLLGTDWLVVPGMLVGVAAAVYLVHVRYGR